MAEATDISGGNNSETMRYDAKAEVGPLSWSQKMSNHIAYALLVYTGLQIFVAMSAIKGDSRSILPYFALVILVALVIPACRVFERRWENIADDHDKSVGGAFRRDAILLWFLAIGLPFAVTGLAKVLHGAF